jgi:hypothetical protein
MGIKLYRKTKRFKTKNGTILRTFGYIEGPLMQMSKMFPDPVFDSDLDESWFSLRNVNNKETGRQEEIK